jgi:hypothetical protein
MSSILNLFLILAPAVWYEFLSATDKVSRNLQSMGADLSTAITLLKGLKEFLQPFRENRLASLKKTSQKVCDENVIPPEFKRTRISKRKLRRRGLRDE